MLSQLLIYKSILSDYKSDTVNVYLPPYQGRSAQQLADQTRSRNPRRSSASHWCGWPPSPWLSEPLYGREQSTSVDSICSCFALQSQIVFAHCVCVCVFALCTGTTPVLVCQDLSLNVPTHASITMWHRNDKYECMYVFLGGCASTCVNVNVYAFPSVPVRW